MEREKSFFRSVCALAVPVALQSMLQASFSIVDQIMIGQLGSVNVAGVGLAGKFSSIFSVVVAAIGVVAGIMISQYIGQKNRREVRRSFYVNLVFSVGLALLFTLLCFFAPQAVMGIYSEDPKTIAAAADYLFLLAGSFLPMAGATLLATLFRCMEKASLPLYASIAAALLNTGLNYVLIFGKLGFAPMGIRGAAIATVISQFANCLCMLAMLPACGGALRREKAGETARTRFQWKQYAVMLLPILICELMWSVGENVYAAIYGHLGTDASAAMTLTTPVQSLVIGALCGLSQAASVIIGKKLGNGENEDAYRSSIKLVKYGFVGSLILSALIVLTRGLYTEIYSVEGSVKIMVQQILVAYAIISPFKIQNMILGGGVLRSGGKTHYIMVIDLVGTWVFGVPLGLLTAFVFHLPIAAVYFILSLEECIRFAITVVVFRRRSWMQQLKA